MTYKQLKSLTSALLTGDYVLTQDADELIMLLNYAYLKIATEADALKLFTFSKDESILREGQGNMFVRMPALPSSDSDILDIDDELCFPAARYIASFISKNEGGLHDREAAKLIRDYNSKVDAYLTSLAEESFNNSEGVQ